MNLTTLRRNAKATLQRQVEQQRFAIAPEQPLAIAPTSPEADYFSSQQFINAVQAHAKNEEGDPILTPPWFEQYLRFLGDFRICTKAISGSAQSGKSLGITLVLAYGTIELGFKMLYSYDSQGAKNAQVTRNLSPILNYWEHSKYSDARPDLAHNKEMWQSQSGGVVQFLYSSVNASGQAKNARQGLASAGGLAVGVKMDGLINEERSQSPPGARDPYRRRLIESKLKPYPPVMDLGTPGAGLGIELDFQKLDHHFYPYYDCPHCGATRPLHPLGCLLKPEVTQADDEPVITWFTESGKPKYWWHHDPMNSETTAYIACSECGGELPPAVRINATYRECRLDIGLEVVQDLGRSLDEFLDALPLGKPIDHCGVGVIISPLLKDYNNGPQIIREGNTCANTADWQQQALGITSRTDSNGITLQMIERAIAAPAPGSCATWRLAGLDQGRREDWLWIVDVWLPEGWEDMAISEVQDQAIRSVVFGEAVSRADVGQLLTDYGVDYTAMDVTPDIPDAVDLSETYEIQLVQQKASLENDVKLVERETSGLTYEVYYIRQKDFQDRVLYSFSAVGADGHPLIRLPEGWARWRSLMGAELSPITHLTAMTRDPETRLWVRPLNHVDDHFFAAMFAEVALYLKITENYSSLARKLALL